MRLRVGLPGPFSVSFGGTRRRRKSSGAGGAVFAVLLLGGLFVVELAHHPAFGIIIGVVLLAIGAARWPRRVRTGWQKIPSPAMPPHQPPSSANDRIIEVDYPAAPATPPAPPVRQQVPEDDPGPKLWVPRSFLDGE